MSQNAVFHMHIMRILWRCHLPPCLRYQWDLITSLCAKRLFPTSDSHLPTFLLNSPVQVVAFAAVLLLFVS